MFFRNKLRSILAGILALPLTVFAAGEEQFSTLFDPWGGVAGFGGITFSNFTLNSSAGTVDRLSHCYQVETADAITHLGFRYGARAATPPTFKISLQAKLTTGAGPTGTVLGGGTPAEGTFLPPANTTWDGTWRWVDITDYTPTRGQWVCNVIEYSSGTIDGTNNSSFTSTLGNAHIRGPFPLAYTQTNAGAWTALDELPIYGYKTASRSYGHPIEDFTGSEAYSSDSTPDERGLRCKIPSTATGTYKIIGAWVQFETVPAAGKTINMNLYTGTSTSVEQTVAIDTDYIGAHGGSNREPARFYFTDTNLDTLTAGTVFRLTFEAVDTSTSVEIGSFFTDTNAELSAFPGGIECYTSTRTNAGAWDSDGTTKRPLIFPIVQELAAAASSSGPKGLNNVSGGMQ